MNNTPISRPVDAAATFRPATPGLAMFGVALLLLGTPTWLYLSPGHVGMLAIIGSALLIFLGLAVATGFFVLGPNESRLFLWFGTYRGAVRAPGLHWANPLYTTRNVGLQVATFETNKLKVNDNHSNPVEIGAVIAWRVASPYAALFEVNNCVQYVQVQSESALRALAAKYPYVSHEELPVATTAQSETTRERALSTDLEEIASELRQDLNARLAVAGVEVSEARISHLAYAPEIAAAMLQRQQASAVVAARSTIVKGAVGMVKDALKQIEADGITDMAPAQKSALVANLLVVLCSERSAQPTLNLGA